MAMIKFDKCLVINIPASEVLPQCRIIGGVEQDVTGYYTNDNPEKKKDIEDFFDNFQLPFFIDGEKVTSYYKKVKNGVYKYYKDNYRNQMVDLDLNCKDLGIGQIPIPSMFFGNSGRYLKFLNDDKTVKKFKGILYEGISQLVIEKLNDKFLIYPLFMQPLFIKDSYKNLQTSNENIDNEIDTNEFKIYGMHMKKQNNAFDDKFPHICIGWSALGDISSIKSCEELDKLVNSTWPNKNNRWKGQTKFSVQIFRFDMKQGDYVFYFDGQNSKAHLGRVVGEFQYISQEHLNNQDSDYQFNRKVEWLISVNYIDIPTNLRKIIHTSRSLFNIYGEDWNKFVKELLNKQSNIDTSLRVTGGFNEIFYGVPGSGKSHYVDNEVLKQVDSDNNYERVVFYPDYSYSDFVGQILPKVNNSGQVEYKFSPGPFTRILYKAYNDPSQMYYLVIEELTRGNAASIFGDIFQLMDRDDNGDSKYKITNFDIAREVFGVEEEKVSIPSNLTILATMNTSDQNVFSLDNAFKRRWTMTRVSNKFEANDELGNSFILDTDVRWKDIIEPLNDFLLNNDSLLTSVEDKQIGAHFVDKKELKNIRNFSNKFFSYLWYDVFKYNKNEVFSSFYNSLDKLIEDFERYKGNDRFNVFNEDIKMEILNKNKNNED